MSEKPHADWYPHITGTTHWKWIVIGAALIAALTSGCVVEEPSNTPQEVQTTSDDEGDASDRPKETAGQANARAKGEEYLAMSAFSRKGLIKQLKFEGFSKKEAKYGAEAQNANWKEQAELKAEEYLEMSAFSRQGLIRQLMFEGFTRKQAEHGVSKTGL